MSPSTKKSFLSLRKSKAIDATALHLIILQIILSLTIIFITNKSIAIILSLIMLAITITMLTLFFKSMIKKVGERNSIFILLLMLISITNIILLFGNTYRWVGIRNSDLSYIDKNKIDSLEDAIYFSFTTWTTVGLGDIIPSRNSRVLVIFEAMIGYFVMAFIIAIIQSMIQIGRAKKPKDEIKASVVADIIKKSESEADHDVLGI